MENSKHTKGNWNQSLNPLSKNKQRIIQTEKALIGFVSTEEVTNEESEANAKLIASVVSFFDYICTKANEGDLLAINVLKQKGYAKGEDY